MAHAAPETTTERRQATTPEAPPDRNRVARRAGHALHEMPRTHRQGLRLARAIHDAVLNGGERARNAADLLHGTWLGHPLHAVLTDITVGAWVTGAAFDTVGALRDAPAARRAGDALAAVGTASAVPTALSGLTDYSTAPKAAAAPATLHGAMNAANLGLYLLSLKHRRSGNRRRGLFYSGAALGLATVSAWLGGELVYRDKVGVDHSDRFTGPTEWTPVLDEAELPPHQPRRVDIDGKDVLLFRDGDAVHAIGAVCSHAGGPLHEGHIRGCTVECPWHNSVFDMRDGGVRHGPATGPQPSFDARVRDARVELRLRRG